MMDDDDNDNNYNNFDVIIYLIYRQQAEHIIPPKAPLTLAM